MPFCAEGANRYVELSLAVAMVYVRSSRRLWLVWGGMSLVVPTPGREVPVLVAKYLEAAVFSR
jgi:hypothetical protein